MTYQTIPTNDVFRTLLHLFGIKDREFIKQLYATQGIDMSTTKIKNMSRKLDDHSCSALPYPLLLAFFQALFEYRDKMREQGIEVFNFPKDNV